MKKVMILIMLLIGGIALAQRGEGNMREGTKDLSAEQIATLKTKKATLALDLTEIQQGQMKALLLKNAEMRKAKMEARKVQKESGERKKYTIEERYARTNERLDYQIAEKAKLKEILSEEQLSKWEKMQNRRGKHKKGKRAKNRKTSLKSN